MRRRRGPSWRARARRSRSPPENAAVCARSLSPAIAGDAWGRGRGAEAGRGRGRGQRCSRRIHAIARGYARWSRRGRWGARRRVGARDGRPRETLGGGTLFRFTTRAMGRDGTHRERGRRDGGDDGGELDADGFDTIVLALFGGGANANASASARGRAVAGEPVGDRGSPRHPLPDPSRPPGEGGVVSLDRVRPHREGHHRVRSRGRDAMRRGLAEARAAMSRRDATLCASVGRATCRSFRPPVRYFLRNAAPPRVPSAETQQRLSGFRVFRESG